MTPPLTDLPKSIEEAVEQAKQSTIAALEDGCPLLQVELVFPEIELQAQAIARQFIPALDAPDTQLKVFFPDTGAAALARRDWGEVPFRISDLGTNPASVETRLDSTDDRFLVISPSPVEVEQVEKLSQLADGRPIVLLNPRLEDIAIVGIGYKARQLRERFISTIESCYYLKPLEGSAALFRSYPGDWGLWREIDGEYQRIAGQSTKPNAEQIEQLLINVATDSDLPQSTSPQKSIQKPGVLAGLQSFLRALSR